MERYRSLVIAVACGLLQGPLTAQTITVRDGAGLLVAVASPVRRVASVMSSAVDIIVALGAADRIAARTRYDTSSVVAKAINLGGGIDPSVEALAASRPDLFIAWKGQATSAVVSRVRALGIPVYLVDTRDTTALFATVRDLGTLLGLTPRATVAATALRAELTAVQRSRAGRPRPSAAFLISRSPVIVAAATSYMAQLVSVAGADNPFRDVVGDFPTMSLEAFIARDPDVLIVGRRTDGKTQLQVLRETPGWRDLRAVKAGAVVEVDGEQWGRPTLHVGALTRELAARLSAMRIPARRPR